MFGLPRTKFYETRSHLILPSHETGTANVRTAPAYPAITLNIRNEVAPLKSRLVDVAQGGKRVYSSRGGWRSGTVRGGEEERVGAVEGRGRGERVDPQTCAHTCTPHGGANVSGVRTRR